MPSLDDVSVRRQWARWFNGNADRWVRPDASRFLIPGTRVETIFPALALKYSPSQPRVPAGSSGGGQWTSGSASGRPRVIVDTTGWGDEVSAEPGDDMSPFDAGPMGSTDFGNIESEIDALGLFGIGPRESERGGIQLAGDLPDGLGGPDRPPEIPEKKPAKSWERTAIIRAVANWAGRATIAGETLTGLYRTYDWLLDYHDVIEAARDPAKTLQELQSSLDTPRPGYDRHHIVEKTAAQRLGFAKDDTEDPDNLVLIPRLKHYQITGWYGTRSDRFGEMSPREYLQDKGWEERRAIGLEALELFGVLKR